MKGIRATIVLAILFLSGCVAQTPAGNGPTSSPVGTATVQSDGADSTGSIVGTVLDDEQRPVPTAMVAILRVGAQVRTAENGSYRFDGVPIGSHKLIVEALGYKSTGRAVEVRMDEETRADFVLNPILLDPAGYVRVVRRTSMVTDAAFATTTVAPTYNMSSMCGQCYHVVHFDPAPLQVFVEPTWQPQAYHGIVYSSVRIWYKWPPSTTTTTLHQSVGQGQHLSDTAIQSLKTSNVQAFNMTVGAGLYTVFLQQRVDTWLSFAYVAKLPEGYTALPDS